MKKLLFQLLYMIVIGGINAVWWVWCKITRKEYRPVGGPQ